HTPFLRFDEVEWAWRIIDPLLKAWQSSGAPEDYVSGSGGPTGQHRFLGPGHAWRPLARRSCPRATRLSAIRRAHRTGCAWLRARGHRTRPRPVTRTDRTAR